VSRVPWHYNSPHSAIRCYHQKVWVCTDNLSMCRILTVISFPLIDQMWPPSCSYRSCSLYACTLIMPVWTDRSGEKPRVRMLVRWAKLQNCTKRFHINISRFLKQACWRTCFSLFKFFLSYSRCSFKCSPREDQLAKCLKLFRSRERFSNFSFSYFDRNNLLMDALILSRFPKITVPLHPHLFLSWRVG
jgi:hypothetical protein